MAWQEIRIQGPDGNGIYGVHNTHGHDRLIVHLHGLTHHAMSLLSVTSGEFFVDRGFDHYSASLYWLPPDSRKLSNSTLSTHVRDAQTILDHFGSSYREIFLTAHSLGGLVALIMNPKGIRALSLWDPSLDVTHFWASGPYLQPTPDRKHHLLDYGNVFLLSQAMVDEIARYPDSACLDLARSITTPTQFIIPEQSLFLASPHTSPEAYKDAFRAPFALNRIDDANHQFSKPNNRQNLFETTLRFFNQHQLT